MRKMNFSSIKIYLIMLLFSTLLLANIPAQSAEESTFSVTRIDVQSTQASVEVEKYSDMWEQAWVWANPEGWINSRAEIQSKDLGFGDKSLNLFIASYSNVYTYFDHANWWFRSTDDPTDRNAELEVQFRTTDASLAKQYADLVVEYANGELGITFEYEGTEAWRDHRDDGSWVDLTRVKYSTHIDFPWFTEYINNSIIPRNVGGLAETIDVTKSTHVSAWAWRQGDESNPEIGFAFGFDFGKSIYEISSSFSGAHTLPINDLIHVTKIQKSSYQGELKIHCELPNVTAITHNPASNTSNIEITTHHHPPPEDWVKHNYYHVNFRITGGTYLDMSVSFTYDFIPWFLEKRVSTDLIINSYGYFFKGIFLQGEYTNLIDLESLTAWDTNIALVEITFNPTRQAVADSFQVSIRYPDYDDHENNAHMVANEIASIFGVSYKTGNWTDSWWWGPNFNGISYNFNSDNFTVVMSENLLTGHDVIQSTPAFEGQNLTALTEYRQTTFYRPAIDGYINQMEFKWNPLSYEIQNPIKDYPGNQNNVNFDLLTEWGWPTYPYSTNYTRSEFGITFPDENEDHSVYPNENNGYGWDIGTWNNNWDNINYLVHNLNIYTEASSLKFNNNTAFGDFGAYINYDFHADSEDLYSPGMHVKYRADNGTEYDDEGEIANFMFSGVDEHIEVHTWDDNSHGIHNWWWNFYFYNTTKGYEEPRFNYTGVKQVKARAYFADLPVRSNQFEKEISLIQTWQEQGNLRANFNLTWDTSNGFADGEWTILFEVEDNSGNTAEGWALHSLVVDNYDDGTFTHGPKIDLESAVNTTVNGTHVVKANVTDDVGLFAVVLTRDGAVWLLNDTNNDDIYEFNWYTMGELEGTTHYFTITAWDMDGHKTIYGYWLEVDNVPKGNPPTVTFMSPSSVNETLTGMYTFTVKVIDDHGVSSVKMQIDDGASYAMSFNPSTGNYEKAHNLSKELNGYRELRVTVIDVDENQHTVTDSIYFTVVGGSDTQVETNPPEWDPARSTLPENLSEYVDEGRYLEYNPVSGNIFFEVAVKDDTGIAAVDFTIYIVDDFSSLTGEPDLSTTTQLLTQSLSSTDTSGDWELYEYTWDSASASDDYYVCEFDVQDTDTVANHLYIRVALETDNWVDDEPTLAGIPGFELGVLIISLTSWSLVTTIRKRKRIE